MQDMKNSGERHRLARKYVKIFTLFDANAFTDVIRIILIINVHRAKVFAL